MASRRSGCAPAGLSGDFTAFCWIFPAGTLVSGPPGRYDLSPLIRRLAGIPAYLAGRYVRDSGTRTAVSVGALITAVALFASLVIMIHSFRRTVEIWTHQTVSGDLFFTTKIKRNQSISSSGLSALVAVLGFNPWEIAFEVVSNRRFFLSYENYPYEFEVLDLNIFFKYADFFWLGGDPDKIRSRLGRGEGVVISEVFSNRTGLTVGDTFKARIETSLVELPVLGLVRDYRTQGGVVFYSLQHLQAALCMILAWSRILGVFSESNQDIDSAVAELRKKIISAGEETWISSAAKTCRRFHPSGFR